jgi:hypothetical protein
MRRFWRREKSIDLRRVVGIRRSRAALGWDQVKEELG